MTLKPLRILLIGGDASMWVTLSASLGPRASQIFVPESIDAASLENAARGIDVIVVVANPLAGEPPSCLRTIHEIGAERSTLVIADPNDHRTTHEALALGVGGFVPNGSDASRLASAIADVAERGISYSGPAADLVYERLGGWNGNGHPTMNPMNAARALASALELKDTYTGGHAERVSALAMRLAGAALLDDAIPDDSLEAAFLLHDVGKIGIPETILTKPGGLTETETRVLQTHPLLGERIVEPLGFPMVVSEVIRHHHERWDGRGYPDGLGGEDIPPAARLFAIADAIDAMTSLRPYRRPMSFDEAIEEVLLHGGEQFDPNLCLLVHNVFLDEAIELDLT